MLGAVEDFLKNENIISVKDTIGLGIRFSLQKTEFEKVPVQVEVIITKIVGEEKYLV